MQFTSTIIMAFAATLAFAAPAPAPGVGDISKFVSFDQNGARRFNNGAFNQNDVLNLLSGFDINGFNNQFGGQFDQNAIQILLVVLGQNQFGNSDLNQIQNIGQFNVGGFAQQFNAQNGSNWDANEILNLLLLLGLVDQNQIQNQFFLQQQIQFASQSCLGF
ncbi:hypothetical protein VTL71DRAFT_14713 [Oculimacula yallundae]|uniref:Uncharacterized protein n=1 Tax=Oculimacula yallundae TaxID=86028 RepID=A0ABR4CJE5_9HELO